MGECERRNECEWTDEDDYSGEQKSQRRGVGDALPDDGYPEEDKGEEKRHFGGGLAIFDEAVAEFDIEHSNCDSGGEGGNEPAAMDTLGGGERAEGDAERVDGFVITANAQ